MKNILLICDAGMSTTVLVNKMKAAALEEKGLKLNIDALPVSECIKVIDSADIVLLAPQVRFQKPQVDELVKGRVPVEIIEHRSFSTLNGKAILDKALKTLGNNLM